jgi:MraZ protein
LFRGNVTVNLDEKGRFAIPARYRDRVQKVSAGDLVVSIAVNERGVGMSDCLWIYPLTAWEELETKLKNLRTTKKRTSDLKRFLIASAFDCEMDSQGRILLPEKLRKFANLSDKRMVLTGNIERLELWNEDVWNIKEAQFKVADEEDDGELDELEGLSF